jgi:uncharacterized protein (PEP-CTERM system associated)
MSCAGTGRHPPSGPAGRRELRQHLKLTLLLFAVAAVERPATAAAQAAPGPTPASSGAASTSAPVPGGAASTSAPVPSGATSTSASVPSGAASSNAPVPSGAPTALPPPPSGPFGLPNPSAAPNTLPSGVTPAPSQPPPSGLMLPAPGAGITTLQLYDPNAPAVVIQPYATIGETFYSNVHYTATDHQAAAETSLIPGMSISADTPRFRGVLTGNTQGSLYIPSSDLDQFSANVFGQGTGMLLADRLFVDVASGITEATTLPGLGFVSPSALPRNQQTLTFTNTVSPYLQESYEGLLQGQLRYRFSATNFGQNTTVFSTTNPLNSNLANGTSNEGTLILATGQDFTRASSRLTVDASNFNSNSTAQNTQFSSFDDIEYFIKPNIAVLGRAGYQNIRYPFAPGATFAGATWLAGGRLGSAAEYGYVALEYGRVEGVYGLTGSADYEITPTLTFRASLQQGISSGAQSFQSSLAGAALSPSGSLVDQTTGLPTTFYNPGVGLNNTVYRQHLYNFGLTEQIGRNSYSLFTYYTTAQPLTPPITAPTNSAGANFTWARDIHPDLNGSASVGYSRTTNVVTVNTATPVGNTSTVTANIGLNHIFTRALTGSVLYTFSYQPNGGVIVNGRAGDVVANTLQFYLTKAF